MSSFKKAEKKKSKLRLGITGPSGSGKTFSALRLTKGLGGRTAVIDTEKGSASLYADKFDFDVLELSPPYSPQRYIEAMNLAVSEGYDNIIMDSISHAWAGEGGLLNQKEQMDARGGNSFVNWAKMTPLQEKFVAALLNCPKHIIVTMRSKQEHVQVQENGKTKIQKVGLAPIQREGFEYELTTVFDVAINHEAETSKDRTSLFVGKIFTITESTGEELKKWLDDGQEPEPIKDPVVVPKNELSSDSQKGSDITKSTKLVTDAQLKRMEAMKNKSKLSWEEITKMIKMRFNKSDYKELTMSEYDEVIGVIEANTESKV